MLDIKCPSCGRRLKLPDDSAALSVQCPMCQAVFSNSAREELRQAMVDGQSGGITETISLRKKRAGEPENAEHITESLPGAPTILDCDHGAGMLAERIRHVPVDGDGEIIDEEAEVAAERAQRVQELADARQAEIASHFRWQRCKLGGKVGIGVGCIIGVLNLLPNPNFELFAGSFGIVAAVSIIGAVHGLLIGAFAQAVGPRGQCFVEIILTAVLTIWAGLAAALMRGNNLPILWLLYGGALYGGASGIPVVFAFGLVIIGVVFVVDKLTGR